MAGSGEGLYFDYDGSNGEGHQQYSQAHPNAHSQHARLSWPMPTTTHQHSQSMTVASSSSPQLGMNAYKRSSSPLPLPMGGQHSYPDTSAAANQLMNNWQMGESLALDTNTTFHPNPFDNPYSGMPFQASPTGYMPPQQQPPFMEQSIVDQTSMNHQPGMDVSNLATLNTSMSMDNPFLMSAAGMEMGGLQVDWLAINGPMSFPAANFEAQLQQLGQQQNQQQHPLSVSSPSDHNLSDIDVKSLSPSENGSTGWNYVEAIFNPQETLHHRSPSDSSLTDLDQSHGSQPRNSWDGPGGSYVDLGMQLNSPSSESGPDSVYSDQGHYPNSQKPSPPPLNTSTSVKPIPFRRPNSSRQSPTSPSKRPRGVSKLPTAKANSSYKAGKAVAAAVERGGLPEVPASSNSNGEEKKKVGRRKGPLSANQRKQASEIRKLGACIRCRFLKKTCDKGDPCAGCQPSHARLWLVPCTRVDIKDLGYFLKGWKADYERHVTLSVSITNVKGFSENERSLLVTHGYGHYLPIKAREVYVRDESVFGVNWVEAHSGQHEDFKVDTARLSAGSDGVSTSMLSEYLDMHIDGGFEYFVDEHFQGTPFVTEMLKIAYRFYTKEKTPEIRKALKLVLAYNLTQAILLVKGFGMEEDIDGKIEDSRSEFSGETAAPMMINFQVKTAMADLWRELQKSLLEDLSQLYSSIYSRDKLKHWPTIFMIASILLVVWEEMQFDCRYRVPDEKVVDKFCHDMESTPVGVIVGLFSAISQKVPAFSEWDTSKHHTLLASNPAVCAAMEEVREGIKKHDRYLRSRSQAKFDRNDFDSLSNMFVSKLVIRAH